MFARLIFNAITVILRRIAKLHKDLIKLRRNALERTTNQEVAAMFVDVLNGKEIEANIKMLLGPGVDDSLAEMPDGGIFFMVILVVEIRIIEESVLRVIAQSLILFVVKTLAQALIKFAVHGIDLVLEKDAE